MSPNPPQKIPRIRQSSGTLTSAERWQVVTKRDATINNFVYAVLTTRIYCRPSCPSRLARRANVQFYDTPSQAEKAGFRPCKRCRPESGGTAAQSNPQNLMVERACQDIKDILGRGLKPRLQDLAIQAGLTPSHFHRVFKKRMGVTPGHYANATLVSMNLHSPPGSLSAVTYDAETPALGLNEVDEVSDLSVGNMLDPGGHISTVTMEAWNEFDDLLAIEEFFWDWDSY
ncbi:Ada DNA repair metal-binding [Penicillium taxi]|uniref:Ada DNA repair metal-binding n=1 Tax=Penicillium taxi TaxID=168475 RepID=UPI0025451692|nr:Ada DNA repair metal-binding [Penicillium taxi]KAJ5908523.1 Ada DNA repair metal-binding [Penicillium taxi]